jgi:CubicO group peptidase (beta-lactamase class C family)
MLAIRRSFVPLLVSVAASAALAQEPAELRGFAEYAERARADWHAPGLAVAVVKDAEIVFERGFGVSRAGESGRVGVATRFAIGSTTKAMTATALLMLSEEGRVDLDAPVVRYLPELRFKDPYVTRELRVRDLLTHRGGLPNTDYLWYEQDTPTPEILSRLQWVEPASSLRTHFLYQNVMYAAAGEVVARVSGRPWAEFLHTRLLDPLGMTGTRALAREIAGEADVASPHAELEGRVVAIENASVDGVAPAGAVWSSAHDMARWVAFLQKPEAARDAAGKPLLPSAALGRLFEPQMTIERDEFYPTSALTLPHWTTYGLGWFQQDYAGQKLDFHTGSIDGMVAIVGLLRDRNVGVVVLSNLDSSQLRHALMLSAFDRYLGRPTRDWSRDLRALYAERRAAREKALAKTLAERHTGTRPSLELARYAGRYRDPRASALEVVRDDDGLTLRFGRGIARLEHWHYDTFRAVWNAAWRDPEFVTFQLDAAGEPSRLEMEPLSFEREMPAPAGSR